MSLNEQQQLDITAELVRAINAIMSRAAGPLDEHLRGMLARLDAGALDLGPDLARLIALMNDAEAAFFGGISRALVAGRDSTFLPALARFLELDLPRVTRETDVKAINRLIARAVAFYKRASERGKASAAVYFRVATGAGRINETEIFELLARGLIDRRSAREVARFLASDLSRRAVIVDPSRLRGYRSRVMRDLARELSRNPNLTDALRKAHLAKKRASLEDGKLLQIITRKGNVRTYRVETYAELTARTEIAEAQVLGEVEAAGQHGIETFRVTGHNTPTPVCKPHELVVYTTARRGPLAARYGRLTDATRPTYHPNCRHRLIAVPYPEEIAA